MIWQAIYAWPVYEEYLYASLIPRPSRPSVRRLQATNTGARRPGYEATCMHDSTVKCLHATTNIQCLTLHSNALPKLLYIIHAYILLPSPYRQKTRIQCITKTCRKRVLYIGNRGSDKITKECSYLCQYICIRMYRLSSHTFLSVRKGLLRPIPIDTVCTNKCFKAFP